MFYSPKLYFRDLWISVPLASIALIQAFLWFSLLRNVTADSGQIFLHYNIIFGVDLVGDWWQLYYLPGVGLLIVLLNYLFSSATYASDKFLARFLSGWTLFFHLFLAIGILLLVRLNS